MKLLSAPRQPFVGLALMAAMGIIAAEIFPLPLVAVTATVIILALCILPVARWPRLLATYAIVGADFFLLHNFQTQNTEGQQLADELGGRPRVVAAIGCVISEPKTAPNGFATFIRRVECHGHVPGTRVTRAGTAGIEDECAAKNNESDDCDHFYHREPGFDRAEHFYVR